MTNRTFKGVLVLSHQGYSFLEDLATQIRAIGLEVYILSSAPSHHHAGRREVVRGLSDWSHVVEGTEAISIEHGLSALEALEAGNHEVLCCISVWDGYRRLMAELNERIGAADVSPGAISLMNDKLSMRRQLRSCGLTASMARLVSPETLQGALCDIREKGKRIFIKPRRGLASFAAFELKGDLLWADVERLRTSIKADSEYATVLAEHPDFIFEDFIEGQEMSFEMIAIDGKAHALGVHEKVGLECGARTTLETACVSPPLGLSAPDLRMGLAYVREVMKALGANAGCYHIEVRRSPRGQWDVIEVNPRVGGAFINQSVKSLTGGTCLLRLWLDALTRRAMPLDYLEMQALSRPWRTTVFRVFFGESGREVVNIRLPDFEPKPNATRLMAKSGERLQQSDREIFIGQMLWAMPPSTACVDVAALVERSRNALEITYA